MGDLSFETIFLSLLLTILLYGAFPVAYSELRSEPIRAKEFTRSCWIFNFLICLFCRAISGAASGAYFLWTPIFCGVGKSILSRKGLISDELELNKTVPDSTKLDDIQKCETPEECVEYFKRKYHDEPDKKLQKILDSSDYTAEAKQAVRLIFKERTEKIKPVSPMPTDSRLVPMIDTDTKDQELHQEPHGDLLSENIANGNIQENRKVRFCRKCGAELHENAAFCHKCGTKIFVEAEK